MMEAFEDEYTQVVVRKELNDRKKSRQIKKSFYILSSAHNKYPYTVVCLVGLRKR